MLKKDHDQDHHKNKSIIINEKKRKMIIIVALLNQIKKMINILNIIVSIKMIVGEIESIIKNLDRVRVLPHLIPVKKKNIQDNNKITKIQSNLKMKLINKKYLLR